MADYDSALPVRGNVTDGSAIYSENTILIAGGSDGTNYQQLNVDTTGALNVVGRVADGEAIEGDPLTNGGLFETGGGSAVDSGDITYLALDAYGRTICVGQVADGSAIDTNAYPVLIAGQDGTNVQALRTDSTGRLAVVIGGGVYSDIVYGTANLVKDTPTTVVSAAGDETIKKVIVSGSGLMKVDLQFGTTGSETTIAVKFNSTANPNVEFDFPDGFDVGATETILVECTNLENQGSPASDFDGYGTLVTENAA